MVGPVFGRSGPNRQDFGQVFSVFWSVRTGPTGLRTELAKKPRPRTEPNVVAPVQSGPVGFISRSGPSGPFAHHYMWEQVGVTLNVC